jgi:hypothetical protein
MATVADDKHRVAAQIAAVACPRASDFQEALLIHPSPSPTAEQARLRLSARDMSAADRTVPQLLLAVR